ncbi:MAG: FAD-binding oxidoreductase, partial [Patulibacter sp.]
DVGVAVYEPRSGFADPAQSCASLAAAAVAAGAQLRASTVATGLIAERAGEAGEAGRVAGARVRPRGGGPEVEIRAQTTVLCSGAWSVALAADAEVALPIRPTAVKLGFVERTGSMHLTVIDAPNGIYLRPDLADRTLVGRRTWTDEPLESADAPLPAVDGAFLTDAQERLVRRLPQFAGRPIVDTRAGMLDMTPDALPLVGPARTSDGRPVDGLFLNCGWSGTGFKTGPAVGEALVELIATGASTLDLSSYATDRAFPALAASAPVRSPH